MPDAPEVPNAPNPMRPVFVYGTLRRGECNDIAHYRPVAQWVGTGTIAGTLHDLGPYPGASLAGDGRITGEVYRVAAEVERQVDRLEGVQADDGGEYRRRIVRVALDDGGDLECLIYEIHPRHVVGAPVIASGDWVRRGARHTDN